MQKTFASLLITLAASVLAIAAAFVVGQRSAEHRIRDDVTRSEERQKALINELRRDLAPRPGAQVAPAVPDAVASIEAEEPATSDVVIALAEPASSGAPMTASAPIETAETTASAIIDTPPSEAPSGDADSTEAPATPIARELFDAVAVGTAYTEVAQKFGREGRAALTMDDASGIQTKQYLWQWTGPTGDAFRVDMRFVNGRMTEKVFRD